MGYSGEWEKSDLSTLNSFSPGTGSPVPNVVKPTYSAAPLFVSPEWV